MKLTLAQHTALQAIAEHQLAQTTPETNWTWVGEGTRSNIRPATVWALWRKGLLHVRSEAYMSTDTGRGHTRDVARRCVDLAAICSPAGLQLASQLKGL